MKKELKLIKKKVMDLFDPLMPFYVGAELFEIAEIVDDLLENESFDADAYIDTDTYRCSCCDEIKNNTNHIYKSWDQSKKPEDSEVVTICRKCHFAMKKAGFKGVKQFLDRK